MYGWVRMLVAVAATGLLLAAVEQGGSAPPMLAWSPITSSGSYEYRTLDAGADQTQSVTFKLTDPRSAASGTLTITLSGSSAFTRTADSCTGRRLGPKKSCGVTIEYAPSANGQSHTGTLTATGPQVRASITLSGNSGAPDLRLSPATLECSSRCLYNFDFGLASSSETWTFTVKNGGKGTSETLRVIFGGDTTFSLTNDTCTGHALAPSATCTFDLTFTAPAGCSATDFPEHVDVVRDKPSFVDYIHLETVAACL